jgi:hypothetical protein
MPTTMIRTLTTAEANEVSGGEFYFKCNKQPGSYEICSNHDVARAAVKLTMAGGSGGNTGKGGQKPQ